MPRPIPSGRPLNIPAAVRRWRQSLGRILLALPTFASGYLQAFDLFGIRAEREARDLRWLNERPRR